MTLIFFPVKAEILYFLKNLVRNFLEFFLEFFFGLKLEQKFSKKKLESNFQTWKNSKKKLQKICDENFWKVHFFFLNF